MMKVFIPNDKEFNYDECKKMFEQNRYLVNDNSSFDDVLQNTLFYSFYDDNVLSLCVYFFKLKNKMWVNRFGARKHHLFNKKCFQTALEWFDCDIWAKCPHKPAVFGLICCGFKKYKDNIYVFRRKHSNDLN